MSETTSIAPRATVRRQPARASYDRELVHGILDAGLVAHVAFVVDGQPFVIPMAYARLDDTIVLHGAAASRLQKLLATGVPASVGVTIVDGLVLARSAFHHSMNYRSVVVFGTATSVVDPEEKRRAFDALVEHVVPGRSRVARPANENELRGTFVVSLAIEDASAKARRGPPIDDAEDLDLPVWAGVIPLPVVGAAPIAAPGLRSDLAPAEHEASYARG